MEQSKNKSNPNPKATAGPVSLLFLWWIRKLFWKNYKHGLTEDDLYDILEENKTKKLGDDLEKHWNAEVLRAKAVGKKPSLLRAIVKTTLVPLILNGMVAVVDNVVLRVLQPLLLGNVVEYFTGTDRIEDKEAYFYTAGILMIVFAKSFLYQHFIFQMTTLGMRVRVACSVLIYRKILRHSRYSMDQSETGRVMNLLTNDVARFDQLLQYIHWLWLSFLQTAVVTYFLWYYVGVSAFIGFTYIFLSTVPLQGYMGKISSQLRKKAAGRTDERMKLMSELVSGIQMIKMYAWEMPFVKLVSHARKKEINTISKAALIKAFLLSSIVFIERSSLFVTLLAYCLFGYIVLPDKVFALAQYYNLLNVALAYFYPMAITVTAESNISIERIVNFLMKEESKVTALEDSMIGSDKISSIGRVAIAKGYASWTPDKCTLKDINIVIEPRTVCAIVGPVGSGKSSLLNVILGELPLSSGVFSTNGKISYASQEPWIFVGTVRQNILFGQRYDPVRYREVVKVCALEKDFHMFPQGDQTPIGARGINLSGGQRARLNLARAMYREADIYLLDDPLSAVDAHVGKRMFEYCIKRFLKEKTCILVTHQLQYLQEADHLIIIQEGGIVAQGSPKELSSSTNNFAKLLAADEEGPEEETERRKTSTYHQSLSPTTKDIEPIEDEEHKEALDLTASPWTIIKQYLLAAGGICLVGTLITILVVGQATTSAADYWVTYWSDAESKRAQHPEGESENSFNTKTYLIIYGGLILAVISITLARSVLFFTICMNASRNLHNSMFESVLKATMRFFDTNPVGRILNRFSKDTGLMDESLPTSLLLFVQINLVMIGILVMIAISNYYMVVFIIVIGAVFWWTGAAFLSLARFIRRLEGIKRSPVFSHVTDTLNGLVTIRASEAINIVNETFYIHQDQHSSSWSLVLSINTALGLWLDIISGIFITIVTVSFHVIGKENVSGASVGLAISQSLILTGMLQYGVLMLTEVVSQSVSVERILQYRNLDSEPPLESTPDRKPPETWPQKGRIEFHDVVLRYGKDDSPVLKNLNFIIEECQKVGVVGRTGAGKSSLLAALFRLANIEGKILIDNIDTGTIGLHDLRRCISIIPQEPVLFSATMRYNLDPFGDFPDDALWTALEEVKLKSAVQSLDWMVTEGGGNLSVGERQLVCLARALLRKNRILVLDEATANVDLETDSLIQRTIRRKFINCTVLTIAHRLNTIMDSDRVLVMDGGRMAEFDHPHVLLQNRSSLLSKLVEETSKSMAEKLRAMAYEAFQSKHVSDADELPSPEAIVTRL
ncbi:ATP-binding cassette sub-family C member 4 [Anabrus simplex]|uniref:ATP-binding cassette sub-family C member 4 n=1 Tax=Anabrus simplex TaxID=316456 RepID=UPI0035A384A3